MACPELVEGSKPPPKAAPRTVRLPPGAVEARAFRDAVQLGRKRAIQILEFFDRVGFTRRVRDEHRLRGSQPFGENEANGPRAS